MKKLSRRDLGRLAAGAVSAGKIGVEAVEKIGAGRLAAGLAAASTTAMAAPAEAPSAYIGPLTGVEQGNLEGRKFDPVAYTWDLYAAAPRRLRFEAQNGKQGEAWQKKARAKLIELLGGFSTERVPLQPSTIEKREFTGYTREKVVFNSRRGVSVLGYVLMPKNPLRTPVPAMVCVPGHGRGVDDIVGIDDKGQDRTDKSGYQHDFAIQVAEAGLAAVAIEPMAFGCRRDPITFKKSLGTSACQPAAGGALLVGQTMIAWRVYDVMRTIDFIGTRPEIDSSRIGCMGISGGGTCTLFSSALEPRIRVAMVSGYLNTFKNSVGSLSHCIDNYVPGVLNWFEMYDIAGLIAPRPLFIESGEKDEIFPIQASIESFNNVKRIYGVFGADRSIEQETFDGPHSFWGKKGVPFVARHLTA